MHAETTFRINAPRVVSQTIQGETIIIDFENGAYFSTTGAGAVIWEAISLNRTAVEIVQAVLQQSSGDQAAVKHGVEQFLEELQRESLIIPQEGHTSSGAAMESHAVMRAEIPAFQAPSLHKYTDMQDLLELDPIHEVDEHGWPVRKDKE